MLGRELMQAILENSLEDDEIVVIDGSQISADPDDVTQYNITSLVTDSNDEGDTVGVLTIAE